jgi:hypothetical protein
VPLHAFRQNQEWGKTLGQIRKQRTVLLTLKVCPSSSDSGIVVDFTILDIALGFFPSPFLALFWPSGFDSLVK